MQPSLWSCKIFFFGCVEVTILYMRMERLICLFNAACSEIHVLTWAYMDVVKLSFQFWVSMSSARQFFPEVRPSSIFFPNFRITPYDGFFRYSPFFFFLGLN